jgi:hypothetical protein
MTNSLRTILIALVAVFLTLGCSSGGGSSTQDDAETLCDEQCDVQEAAAIERCENTYVVCIDDDAGDDEDCKAAALLTCGLEG